MSEPVRTLGTKRRGVLIATLVSSLVLAATPLVVSGVVHIKRDFIDTLLAASDALPAGTELAWLTVAGVLVIRDRRAALHVLWWGAIALLAFGLVPLIVDAGQGMFGFMGHHDDHLEAVAHARATHIWGPFVLATIPAWIGSTVVWIATRVKRPPASDPVPTVRVHR